MSDFDSGDCSLHPVCHTNRFADQAYWQIFLTTVYKQCRFSDWNDQEMLNDLFFASVSICSQPTFYATTTTAFFKIYLNFLGTLSLYLWWFSRFWKHVQWYYIVLAYIYFITTFCKYALSLKHIREHTGRKHITSFNFFIIRNWGLSL